MRTKLATAFVMAAVLTAGSAAIASAQPAFFARPINVACTAPAPNESGYGSRQLSLQECQQASIANPPSVVGVATVNDAANATGDMPIYGGFAPNLGFSAHHHPHGHRHW